MKGKIQRLPGVGSVAVIYEECHWTIPQTSVSLGFHGHLGRSILEKPRSFLIKKSVIIKTNQLIK